MSGKSHIYRNHASQTKLTQNPHDQTFAAHTVKVLVLYNRTRARTSGHWPEEQVLTLSCACNAAGYV